MEQTNSAEDERIGAPDIAVIDEGSLVIFDLRSKAAVTWVSENVDTETWQWRGATLVVDLHYAADLIERIESAGLSVEQS